MTPVSVKLPRSPRIVLAGAVDSTRSILQGMLRNRANVVGVLGLGKDAASGVSGYCRIDDLASEADIPYSDFTGINEPAVVGQIRNWKPDLLFAVGLSQLVKPELLGIPAIGCVGFHPTRLPEGRGRAPIAWLTLETRPGAATFFLMDEGADSGPILAQEPFDVTEDDYAEDVVSKVLGAIDIALDRWIPRLMEGEWQPAPQAEAQATVYGRRSPEDGQIDWEKPAGQIRALVRAASRPHPGAYTYADGRKIIVWRASQDSSSRYRGVAGRVLRVDGNDGVLVQTGKGLLRLTEVEGAELKVGMQLGYRAEDEIQKLRGRVAELENRIRQLEG